MISEVEQEMFSRVFANESTCRAFLEELKNKGVTYSMPIDSLTHEDCINVAIHLVMELERKDRAQAEGGSG